MCSSSFRTYEPPLSKSLKRWPAYLANLVAQISSKSPWIQAQNKKCESKLLDFNLWIDFDLCGWKCIILLIYHIFRVSSFRMNFCTTRKLCGIFLQTIRLNKTVKDYYIWWFVCTIRRTSISNDWFWRFPWKCITKNPWLKMKSILWFWYSFF